ncbi:hypothetical protein HPULCUR_010608 [Helicostylum pulchrum]|uniref:Cleavage/polyadenylation specificity factor A subunit C-terminal domain-containing protein n=1 Tax=Helicostylum pulchrum TaxID=562976 RepID=A0ABP9YDQ4_9FUNG
MNEFEKLTLNNREYLYDIDTCIVYNFTHDQVEYVYTQNQTEITEVLTAKQLHAKLELNIQSVLYCRYLGLEPALVILTLDREQTIHIFYYHVTSKQILQVATNSSIKNEISKASITRDPFNVVFKNKKYAETKSCYGLVIGTVAGENSLSLIHIDMDIFEANVMSIESIKSEIKSELGYVTSIHILPPDKGDRRMGHSDPQILLGYSKGAVLIYRYRANIYSRTANRLRAPIDLSEFTEFPDYPITSLSGVRSYNSLGMTVVFSQEKPLDNVKYEYSRSYIKIVETHGDSTRKQRKIINPTLVDSIIFTTNLLLSSFKTTAFDPDIQLSILLQNKDTFELEIWSISPTHIQRNLDLELDKETCFSMLPGRKLRSNDLLGYYQRRPQKLIQTMLEYQKNLEDEHSSTKRKAETSDTTVNKKLKNMMSPTTTTTTTSLDLQEQKVDSEMDDVDHQNIPTEVESELSSQANPDSSVIAEDSDLMDFENIGSNVSTDEEQNRKSIRNEQIEQETHNIIASNLEDDQVDSSFFNTIVSSVQKSSNQHVTNDVDELVKADTSNTTLFKSIQESIELVETRKLEDTTIIAKEEPTYMTDSTIENAINAREIDRAGDVTVELPEIGKTDVLSVKDTTEEIAEKSIERTETYYTAVEDTDVKPTEQAITVFGSNVNNGQVTNPMGVIIDVRETENTVTEDTDVKPSEKSATVNESSDDNEELVDETMEIGDTKDVVPEDTDINPVEGSITMDEFNEDSEGAIEMHDTKDVATEITDVDPAERPITVDNRDTEEMTKPVVMDAYNTIPVDETSEQKLNEDSSQIDDDLMEILEPNDSVNQDSTVEAVYNVFEEGKNEFTEAGDQGSEYDPTEIMEETIKMAEAINSITEEAIEEVVETDQGYAAVSEMSESTVNDTTIDQKTNGSIDLNTVDNTVEPAQENTLNTGREYIGASEMVHTTAGQSEPDRTDLLQHVESLSTNQSHLDNNYNQSMQLLEDSIIRGNLLELVEQVTTREESQVLQDDQLESDQEYTVEQSVAETSFLAESEHDILESTIEIGSSDSEIDATDLATDEVVSDELAPSNVLSQSDISFEEEEYDIPDYEHESFDENDDIPDYEHQSFDGEDIPNYEQEYIDENGIPEVSYSDDQDMDAAHISDDSDGLGYQSDTGEHDGLGSQADIGEPDGNGVYDENEEASIILGSEDSEDSDHAGEISLRSEGQIESMEEVDVNEDSLAVETDVSSAQSLIASPSVTETRESTPVQDMEQVLKLSEQKFSELLYQVTGEEDISSFMEQPLIPRDQLDELGISCWYNPDPHMKLTLVRYCDKHNLGTNIVPLCYTLKKSKKDLTKDEIDEYTTIYKKHFFKFPMYNQDINVFDVEGRQQLLQAELNYYKKSATSYTDPEAEENRKIYNGYYGLGLL